MSDVTRRDLVRKSAAAAAGMTVMGAIAADVASADSGPDPSPSSPMSAIRARARSRS